MGFTIFESSGTFKPSDYGLSPGDVIHVTAVGGGGGGSYGGNYYGSYAGGAGGASSFGSILTAAGGAPGSVERYPSIVTVTGRNNPVRGYLYYARYFVPNSSGNSEVTVQIYVGSQGADGWLPDRPFKTTPSYPHRFFLQDLPSTAILSPSQNSAIRGATSLTDEHIWNVGGYTTQKGESSNNYNNIAPLSAAQSVPMAGYGSSFLYDSNSSGMQVALGGAGGVGYGAGGGGSYNYTTDYGLGGGYSGVKADTDYVLPSMDEVPVTVGNGGAGYINGSASYQGAGGGARGCVAIWW